MATGLQAKNTLNLSGAYYSGGYPGEDTGATGDYQDWTDIPLSGSSIATYWYSDSDNADNANSIKVFVDVEENWTAVVNNDNSIDITYSTTIKKIEKKNMYGNPGVGLKHIKISTSPYAPWIYEYLNTTSTLYVVAQNLPTISGTIHLNPLSDTGGISTIYYKSGDTEHFDDPLPSVYVDAMGMGTSFRNILPPDYRPGQRKISDTWYSHNRAVGNSRRKVSGTWTEMRTENGGVGTNNPPKIKTSGTWYNQKEIGQE